MNVVEGLQRWLTLTWGTPVTIEGAEVSPAGARRTNVLFGARTAGELTRLVATIVPTPEIQLLDVGTESAVRTVAAAGGVPVPAIRGVCLDSSVVGGPFFLSDLVEGVTIPRRVLRLAAEQGTGEHIVEQLGVALGRLHAIDPALAPAGLPRPPEDSPVGEALERVRLAVEAMAQPEPAFAYGLRWLDQHRPPEPARCAVVHTDVRTGNLIVGSDGLRAILDWEGAHLGDPMEDVAWPCTRMWRFGADALTVGGLAGLGPYRASYEAAGGTWDAERFRWWRVLETLRWGTGLAGQAAAHLDGRFRSIVMAGSGRRVSEMAYDVLTLVRPG